MESHRFQYYECTDKTHHHDNIRTWEIPVEPIETLWQRQKEAMNKSLIELYIVHYYCHTCAGRWIDRVQWNDVSGLLWVWMIQKEHLHWVLVSERLALVDSMEETTWTERKKNEGIEIILCCSHEERRRRWLKRDSNRRTMLVVVHWENLFQRWRMCSRNRWIVEKRIQKMDEWRK